MFTLRICPPSGYLLKISLRKSTSGGVVCPKRPKTETNKKNVYYSTMHLLSGLRKNTKQLLQILFSINLRPDSITSEKQKKPHSRC